MTGSGTRPRRREILDDADPVVPAGVEVIAQLLDGGVEKFRSEHQEQAGDERDPDPQMAAENDRHGQPNASRTSSSRTARSVRPPWTRPRQEFRKAR
jgi:hypothetical protein